MCGSVHHGTDHTPDIAGIDHLATVDEIEQRSGSDFFWQLPDAEENAMESIRNLSWAQSFLN